MIDWLTRLRVLPKPFIDPHQALDIARRECASRGWPWEEPVRIEGGFRSYVVRTNSHSRGANVIIRISKSSGAVLSATFVRR